MTLLEQLNHRYPITTGCVGILGSCSGWFFAHLDDLNRIVSLLGLVLGVFIAILTVREKLRAEQRERRRDRDRFERDRWERDDLNY